MDLSRFFPVPFLPVKKQVTFGGKNIGVIEIKNGVVKGYCKDEFVYMCQYSPGLYDEAIYEAQLIINGHHMKGKQGITHETSAYLS